MEHGFYSIWEMDIDSYKDQLLSEMYDDTRISFDYIYLEEAYPDIWNLMKISEMLWRATVQIRCFENKEKDYFEYACRCYQKQFSTIEDWSLPKSQYDSYTVTVLIKKDMSIFDAYNYIVYIRDRIIEDTNCCMYKKLCIEIKERINSRMPVYQRAMNKVKLEISNYITDNDNNIGKIIDIGGRVKELESIEEKVYRKSMSQYEALDRFDDLAGVRCICEYLDDVYDVLNYIKENPLLNVIEIDDKIEVPSEQGYRGIQVIVAVDVYFQGTLYSDVKVEVQLRTAFQNAWSTKTHVLTYKKEQHEITHQIQAMQELGDKLFEADMVAQKIKQAL